MKPALSPSQSRRIDELALRQYHIPGIVLMENAGRGCAEWLLAQSNCRCVTVLAGKGNNAGDGFVIARHLHNRGVQVQLILLSPPEQFTGDALINWKIVNALALPVAECFSRPADILSEDWLNRSDWVVDALLGTGLSGTVREPFFTAISTINRLRPQAGWQVLAVDLPSGLDGASGEVLGACLKADHTATFVAPKQGLLQGAGPDHTGQLQVIEIGTPPELLQRVLSEGSGSLPV